ncbi:MAG TPA: hypothetical protein VHL09_05085 [Dehalococcoidia bacterium]|nr:hypothetical protein [Dehalococcoidia bacterium]
MTSPVSLRPPSTVEEKVRWMAVIERRSLVELVGVLAVEGLKFREFPGLIFVDGPTGRRARFRDGPDVWEVLEPYVLADRDWAILRASYPDLDEATLRTAIRSLLRELSGGDRGAYRSAPGDVTLRLLLDEDLRYRVAEGLRRRDVDAISVHEVDRANRGISDEDCTFQYVSGYSTSISASHLTQATPRRSGATSRTGAPWT